MNKHYTYVYLDPSKPGNFYYRDDIKFDFEPFYIGEGKNKRMYDHLNEAIKKEFIVKGNRHKFYRIKQIIALNHIPIIMKLKDNITEEDALAYETELILLIGRRDLGRGPLTNLTDGGNKPPDNSGEKNAMYGLRGNDHPAAHWARSAEYLESQSISHRGELNAQYGKKWSEDRKLQFSEFQKKRISQIPPEKRPKATFTEEYRQHMSEKFSGEGNPRWGAKLSKDTKQKISRSHKESGIFSGKNNPKAKTWKIISPEGNEYRVDGEVRKFCNEHNIGSSSGLIQAGLRGKPVTRGISKGWIAFEIKERL